MKRRTLATMDAVAIGLVVLTALALVVGLFRPTTPDITNDPNTEGLVIGTVPTTGTLVVHCQDHLNAYVADQAAIGGNVGVAQHLGHAVASSHDSATARGWVEFALPRGLYVVTDNHEPPRCAALATVVQGWTTTAENHAGFAGLSKGGLGSSQVPATPSASPSTAP
jgi:hypothetical protein